jgi:putative DNA primase/helicase
MNIVVNQFSTTAYLSPKHKSHIESRGLLNDWSFTNCRTASADEASVYLGYPAKSGGILFLGKTTQFQFRPDKPWKSEGCKKAPKYRTPVGDYDAFLPQHPTDKGYWEPENLKQHCYRIDDIPCIVLSEGPFKAMAGCANGIPTIALLGVSMGLTPQKADVQNKRYLVSALEKYARVGFGFIFAFDADAAANPNITWEQRKLGRQLLKFNIPVYSITGAWDVGTEGETKGMDDFIQKKGIEEFRRMLVKSVSFEDWESNQESGEGSFGKSKKQAPPPQVLGAELAEDLRDRLCYSDEHKSWMKYELRHKGVWAAVNDDYVLSAIDTMCQTRGLQPNNAYCANVLGSLKRKLFELDWLERPSNELLPFEDGVLEIESNTWQEHAPGFRLTWSLPRSYKGSAVNTGWAKINDWMNQATDGNRNKKDILIAFIAASLRGMAHLHKFLMLTGPGGTGKGLYSRLTTMVVGERNTWIGNLEDLTASDKVADLQTKRLAVFDDQEKYTGNLSNFRSLTGGGKISGRQLYKSAVDFRFSGLALITANQPCFPASGLSWLKRRIIQEGFEYTPIKRNPHLERELEPELSAFTQYLLSIPVTEIERILAQEGTGINGTFWADRVRADPMASWVNDCIIHDAEAKTAIGADKDEWKDADYVAAKSSLFGSYNNYCRRAGYSAKGKNNFSADLVELCREVLEWKDVAKERSAAGMAIKGLRLRTDTDQDISTVEDLLAQSKNVDLGLQGADPNVDLQSLPHKACVDNVDLNSKLAKKNEITSADSSLETDSGTTPTSWDQMNTAADVVEVLPSPKADTAYTSHTAQDIQPTQGLHSGLHSGQHFDGAEFSTPINEELAHPDPSSPPEPTTQIETPGIETQSPEPFAPPELNLNEEEIDLLQMIQLALASTDPEEARQAALDIQPILKLTCANGCADKKKIWDALTEDEQVKFSALLRKPLQPEVSLAPVSEQQPVPEPSDPASLEPVPPQKPGEPQPAQITMPESETITPEDAEKMRDIALIWWDEYYSEQLQNLLVQMFGWKSPGTKYSREAIGQWLESEDAVVRERLDELWRMKHGEGLIDSPDCGF